MSFPNIEHILNRLQQSSFRARFTLGSKEITYLNEQGMEKILSHAQDFIKQRLAPAEPKNDGKQTPWRGHPVFIAQHATATCCRGCLEKWHQIHKHKPLTNEDQKYIQYVIQTWIDRNKKNIL